MTEKTADSHNKKIKTSRKIQRLSKKAEALIWSAGPYYTVFGQLLLPFLLYLLPIIVITDRFNRFIARYIPVALDENIQLVTCLLAIIFFAAVLILAPMAATVIEFVLGFAYLFLAFSPICKRARLHPFDRNNSVPSRKTCFSDSVFNESTNTHEKRKKTEYGTSKRKT